MSFCIPCKNFTHLHVIKQILKICRKKNFFKKPSLPHLETFYILIVKVPCMESL